MPRLADQPTDVRLTNRPEVAVVAAALCGRTDDDTVLDRAIDVATTHGARLLVIATYEPVGPWELARAQRDAPADVCADHNPGPEVERMLLRAAHMATSRGLLVTTVAAPGRGARPVHRIARKHHADVLVIDADPDRARRMRRAGRPLRRVVPGRGELPTASDHDVTVQRPRLASKTPGS